MITKNIFDGRLKKLRVIRAKDIKAILPSEIKATEITLKMFNGVPVWQVMCPVGSYIYYPFSGTLVYEENLKVTPVKISRSRYGFHRTESIEFRRAFLCVGNMMIVLKDEKRYWMTDIYGCPGFCSSWRFFRPHKN